MSLLVYKHVAKQLLKTESFANFVSDFVDLVLFAA